MTDYNKLLQKLSFLEICNTNQEEKIKVINNLYLTDSEDINFLFSETNVSDEDYQFYKRIFKKAVDTYKVSIIKEIKSKFDNSDLDFNDLDLLISLFSESSSNTSNLLKGEFVNNFELIFNKTHNNLFSYLLANTISLKSELKSKYEKEILIFTDFKFYFKFKKYISIMDKHNHYKEISFLYHNMLKNNCINKIQPMYFKEWYVDKMIIDKNRNEDFIEEMLTTPFVSEKNSKSVLRYKFFDQIFFT